MSSYTEQVDYSSHKEEQSKELLKEVLAVLNIIPNRVAGDTTTYVLASKIEKYLKSTK